MGLLGLTSEEVDGMNKEIQKAKNKVTESSKRNSMGIGTAIATIITWASTTFLSVPIPPEVAVSIAGVLLMLISEIKDKDV